MKILIVADPHGSETAIQSIEEKGKDAEMILIAGDFTIFGRDERRILQRFDAIGKPVIIIPGNHEVPEVTKRISESLEHIIYLNEEIYEMDNRTIFAIEGNGFAHKDEHFEEVARKLAPRLKKRKRQFGEDHRFILMTHAPPHGTACDTVWEDEHCGNESIERFIREWQPDFAICGHIHEDNDTEDWIGRTHVINPGPYGRIIDW